MIHQSLVRRNVSARRRKSLDTCHVSGYRHSMIKRFRHRGLERYFLKGAKVEIHATHEKRIRLILARLHASTFPQDMRLPGLDLHELKGNRKGTWSVSVSGNWRITFAFDGVDAVGVDYEDYR